MDLKIIFWCTFLYRVLCEGDSVEPTLKNNDGIFNNTLEFKTTPLFTYSSDFTSAAEQESTVNSKVEKENDTKMVLEYKPTRPWYLPEPSTVPQLIPPGKPLPASPEEYVTKSTLSPHLINRFPELTSTTMSTKVTNSRATTTKVTKSTRQTTLSTHIVLEYKPQRPWYLPEPNIVGQIIPPGKPWPASPEEYATFSKTTNRPNKFDKQKNPEQDESIK